MMGTLAVTLLVVLAGVRVRDGLRLRQQELVLAKLDERDAVAYYAVLRRRVRNTRILRAITLAALCGLLWAWRHGLVTTM